MSVYSKVQIPQVSMHAFDNSYDKKFTCDMMQIIPVYCDEINPNETIKISHETVIRFQPLLAPILHEINVFLNYYFVPYRLLWEDWEKFITRVNGEEAPLQPRYGVMSGVKLEPFSTTVDTGFTGIGMLWDYFGFQTGVSLTENNAPVAYPWLAYNMIWNEYYRDENLQNEVPNGLLNPDVSKINDSMYRIQSGILYRDWKKDYFTSALPFQQRGTAPALPISGFSSAVFDSIGNIDVCAPQRNGDVSAGLQPLLYASDNGNTAVLRGQQDGAFYTDPAYWEDYVLKIDGYDLKNQLSGPGHNTVDLSNAITSDISDLRLAIALQHRGEVSARGGRRYIEFLQANYGAFPRDDRLQRPEYIGGTVNPVIVSEVLQHSDSKQQNTPTGTLYGKATSVGVNHVGTYRAKEFGLVMGLLTVCPKPVYQTGIPRQWSRMTPEDYFNPLFNGLSEQAILNKEIFSDGSSSDNEIWGYTGMYNELRQKNSMICGKMRDDFDYWHLSRKFDSLPNLNSQFVTGRNVTKRIFAVPSEPGLIVNHSNNIKIIRAIPRIPTPGINTI